MSNTPGRQYTNRPVPDMNGDLFVATGIETAIGDLLYFDLLGNLSASPAQKAVAKPVSQILDQGSALATQELAAQYFCGVSGYNQKANDTSPNPAAHQARIWVRQEWRDYPCVIQTWELGDLVAPAYTPTGGAGALSDQLLTKTTNVAAAIGRVTKRFPIAAPFVQCALLSRLLETGFMDSGTVVTLGGVVLIGPQASIPAAAIVPVSGGTLTPPGFSSSMIVNPVGPITSMVLAVGVQDGQQLTVLNQSANTITFAASGSNVADGASAVIPALRAMYFEWSAALSLWLHT